MPCYRVHYVSKVFCGPDEGALYGYAYITHIESTCTTEHYEGCTESHEQLFFACELGTADEGECDGRWNQLLCYP